MSAQLKRVHAHCSNCLRTTKHDLLHETSTNQEESTTTYAMLQCCGCGRVCLAEQVLDLIDGTKETQFYPPPVSRKRPGWLVSLVVVAKRADLGGLLNEIYEAVHGGQNRLAGMGIRALMEQLMISKVGDRGSFEQNLSAFHDAGYISVVQRETLSNILQLGHGAMHRAFCPKSDDLAVALDIVEGVLASIFHHPAAAEAIAGHVPPRQPSKKS